MGGTFLRALGGGQREQFGGFVAHIAVGDVVEEAGGQRRELGGELLLFGEVEEGLRAGFAARQGGDGGLAGGEVALGIGGEIGEELDDAAIG